MPYPDPFQFPALRDVQGAQLPDFLERDVMPGIAGRYRALTGAANSALWGDSYAGAAALYIAIHHPGLFDRMIVESPSFDVGNGQLLRDSESLLHIPSRIALGIGMSEVPESDFPGYNAAWARMMGRLADNLKAVAWQAAGDSTHGDRGSTSYLRRLRKAPRRRTALYLRNGTGTNGSQTVI